MHCMMVDRALDAIVDHVDYDYMHDIMHCMVMDGVAHAHLYLALESFISAGQKDIYEHLKEYMGLWQYPGRLYSAQLPDIVSESRNTTHREAQRIKRQASYMLSLIPVVELFQAHDVSSWVLLTRLQGLPLH